MRGQLWNFGFFFIFCSVNLYSDLFSKIPFKGSETLKFSSKSKKVWKSPFSPPAATENGGNLYTFFLLVKINAIISTDVLWIYYSACLYCFQSINLIWKSLFVYNILGRSKYINRGSWAEGLLLANFNTIKSPLVHRIWSRNNNFLKTPILLYLV